MVGEILGVDLDRPSMLRLLISYFNARQIGEVEVYKTRKGYHIYVGVPSNIEVRRYLGDDSDRLRVTEIRKRIHGVELDVMFRMKRYGNKWYCEEEFNPLSEPWWNPRCVIKRKR